MRSSAAGRFGKRTRLVGNNVSYSAYLEAFSQIRVPVVFPKAAPNLEPRDDIGRSSRPCRFGLSAADANGVLHIGVSRPRAREGIKTVTARLFALPAARPPEAAIAHCEDAILI